MTTDITPIEALKTIKEICKNSKQLTCTNNGCCQISTCEEIEKIIAQALALQEDNGLYTPLETAQNEFFQAECINGETDVPQECDVEQCDFWQQGETNEGLFDFCTGYCDNCNKHPNCNFRQLHPQQKTFTLEGIKEKIKYFENTHNSEVVNFMFKRLLAEFEKEAK